MTRPLAAPGMDPLDDKVRARLAEIRAAAGVPHAQVSLDVLYFLPKGFLDAYAELFMRAVKSDAGGSGVAASQQEQGELGKARGRGAKTNGKRYKRTFVVLDDKALDIKQGVDKRLRNLGRDLLQAMNTGELTGGVGQSACPGCGMYLQAGWKFCPRDGQSKVDVSEG